MYFTQLRECENQLLLLLPLVYFPTVAMERTIKQMRRNKIMNFKMEGKIKMMEKEREREREREKERRRERLLEILVLEKYC